MESGVYAKGLGERGRRQLLAMAEEISPLPEAVAALQQLVQESQGAGQVDPAAVTNVLKRDPVLTGKLIQLVNSPLFALRREVDNLHAAVVMIGIKPLRNLAMAYAMTRWPPLDLRCYDLDQQQLWEHGWCVGRCAQRLAQEAGLDRDDGESLFLAGLLHDLGKALLAPALNKRQARTRHFPGTTCELERAMLGIDHAQAGSYIAAHWGMTESVQELIAQHHEGDRSAPGDYRILLACLRLAEAAVHEGTHTGNYESGAIYRDSDRKLLAGRIEDWPKTRADLIAEAEASLELFAQLLS